VIAWEHIHRSRVGSRARPDLRHCGADLRHAKTFERRRHEGGQHEIPAIMLMGSAVLGSEDPWLRLADESLRVNPHHVKKVAFSFPEP
jgi:hypothetical protein